MRLTLRFRPDRPGAAGAARPRSARPGSQLAVLATILVAALLASPPAWAQQEEPEPVPGGCELGLVLSGGGARGIAHIGVLEVLQAHGVIPDCLAGASMGAVVASFYASGHTMDEVRELVSRLTWRNVYAEPQDRRRQPLLHRIEQQRSGLRLGLQNGGLRFPESVLNDAELNRVLIEHLSPPGFAAGRDFNRLPIPFRTVGTDLRTGGRVVLASGDLALAVRSSMSVPLAYPAVEWGDALLVDGGMVENVPVRLAQEMGAAYVIAVDVSTPIEADFVPDVLGVTQRIIDLLFSANNNRYQLEPELMIRPQLGRHSFADYSRPEELIELGRQAALEALERIPERFRDRPITPPSERHSHDFGERTVTRVEVAGNRYLSDATLLRELTVWPGETLSFPDLLDDLEHVRSTGLLQSVWLDLKEDGPEGVMLRMRVTEQYRNTVDVGLAYQSDDQAQAMVRFETRDLFGNGERLQVGGFASARDLRGTLRLHGEKVFNAHLGYEVDLTIHDEKPKFFVDGEFIARAVFKRRSVGVATNIPFGLNHLLTLGMRVGRVTTAPRLGLLIPEDTQDQRQLIGHYIWDNLSSTTLPDRGRMISAQAERNEPVLGATYDYWRLKVDYHEALRTGPVITQLRALYGWSGGDLPVSEQFHLGGPEIVPGLAREQLWGDQVLGASLQIGFDPISLLRAYGRLGAGNVWARPGDVALDELRVGFGVGIVVATPVGPMVADWGTVSDGGSRFYFAFGWQ